MENLDVIEEHHYTVEELAEHWNLSTNKMRKIFQNEKGVVIFKTFTPGKRPYETK